METNSIEENNENLQIYLKELARGGLQSGCAKFKSNAEFVKMINKRTINGISLGASVDLKLQVHKQYGRHLISECDITAGDVVMVERPLVLAPNIRSPFSKVQLVCVGCFTVTQSDIFCPTCGYYFCSKNCWLESIQGHHKDECDILSCLNLIQCQSQVGKKEEISAENGHVVRELSLANVTNKNDVTKLVSANVTSKTDIIRHYPCLAVLRTLLAFRRNPFLEKVALSLQANMGRNLRQFFVNQQTIVDMIQQDLEFCSDMKLLHQIAAIWDTNGFEVQLSKGARAQGLYIAASLFNHSCIPNLEHWFSEEGDLIMRAVEDIPKDTPLTICYTEALWPTCLRIEHLRVSKQFSCTCNRCIDGTELGTYLGSSKCAECGSFLLPSRPSHPASEWLCPNDCTKGRLSAKQVMSKEAVCAKTLGQVKVNNPTEVQQSLRKAEKEFYSSHHLLLRLRHSLLDAFAERNLQELKEEDFVVLEEACRVSFDTCRRLYPRYSRHRARKARMYLLCQLERARRDQIGSQGDSYPQTESLQELRQLIEETNAVLGWDSRMPPMNVITDSFRKLNRGQ